MMKRILFLFVLLPSLCLAQHQLKGTFSPPEHFNWAILYQVTPSKVVYKKDAKIVEGLFEISLDSTVEKGSYRIVYGTPQDKKSFDFMYDGKEDIEFSFSEKTRGAYTKSRQNMVMATYLREITNVNRSIGIAYASNSETIEEDLRKLFLLQGEVQEKFESVTKTDMVGEFIRSSRPYIPSTYETAETYYSNKRTHYFKHVDVTSNALQGSKFIFNHILQYITKKEDLDEIAAFLAPADIEYRKLMLYRVWNKAVELNRPDIANYLSKNHLIPLAKELEDTAMVNQLVTYESLSLGAKAPNFSWKDGPEQEGDTLWLHDLKGAENYVLIFWSSTCSHCLEELPKVQKAIQSIPSEQYKVVAIGLEEEPYGWRNEISRYPEFQHVLGLGKWDNDICKTYGVGGTPTYFVLNKDKIITAKPDGLDALVSLLSREAAAKEK